MRHRNTGRILGREKAARKALLKNLAVSVVLYEKVKTTEAKAKEVRGLVERMITRGKTPTVASRRLVRKNLSSLNAVRKIFEVLGPRYQSRAGGYTRIIKLGRRQGDAAPIVLLELV